MGVHANTRKANTRKTEPLTQTADTRIMNTELKDEHKVNRRNKKQEATMMNE